MREFSVSKIRKLLEAHHSLTCPANEFRLAAWVGALPGNRAILTPYLAGKPGLLRRNCHIRIYLTACQTRKFNETAAWAAGSCSTSPSSMRRRLLCSANGLAAAGIHRIVALARRIIARCGRLKHRPVIAGPRPTPESSRSLTRGNPRCALILIAQDATVGCSLKRTECGKRQTFVISRSNELELFEDTLTAVGIGDLAFCTFTIDTFTLRILERLRQRGGISDRRLTPPVLGSRYNPSSTLIRVAERYTAIRSTLSAASGHCGFLGFLARRQARRHARSGSAHGMSN